MYEISPWNRVETRGNFLQIYVFSYKKLTLVQERSLSRKTFNELIPSPASNLTQHLSWQLVFLFRESDHGETFPYLINKSIGKGRYFLFPISTTICLFAVPIFFLSVLWNRRKSVFISSVVVSHQVLKGVKLIELLFRKIYIYVPDFSTFRLGVNRVHMLITYHAYVM